MHSARSKLTPKANPQFIFDAIGTHWIIDLNQTLSNNQQSQLLSKIYQRIEQFDQDYSRFRNDSIVMQISRLAGQYRFSADFPEMIDIYKKMYDLTDGLMTPLVGNLLEQAGYDQSYSLRPKPLSQPKPWSEVLNISGTNLTANEPVTLDFGALGKGYLIDLIGKLLQDNQISSYCIDAGGDLLINNMPMTVGLEHPVNPTQVIGADQISQGSICASAGNRRKWGQMHHIFNPKTLQPVTEIVAVWAKADQATIADALTTALFFVDPAKLSSEFKFEYLIVYQDYSFQKSPHFPDQLYVS